MTLLGQVEETLETRLEVAENKPFLIAATVQNCKKLGE